MLVGTPAVEIEASHPDLFGVIEYAGPQPGIILDPSPRRRRIPRPPTTRSSPSTMASTAPAAIIAHHRVDDIAWRCRDR
jgi:hypothetical protein